MQVQRFSSNSEFDSLANDWDCLAGDVPFLWWKWLRTWWHHFGADHELYLLVVRGIAGRVEGVAPWYLEKRGTWGRVVQFLGSGDVSSDYLSVLCRPGQENAVVDSVCAWMLRQANGAASESEHRWDRLELIGIDLAALANTVRQVETYLVHDYLLGFLFILSSCRYRNTSRFYKAASLLGNALPL